MLRAEVMVVLICVEWEIGESSNFGGRIQINVYLSNNIYLFIIYGV